MGGVERRRRGFFVLPDDKVEDGKGFFVLRSRKNEEPPAFDEAPPPLFSKKSLPIFRPIFGPIFGAEDRR